MCLCVNQVGTNHNRYTQRLHSPARTLLRPTDELWSYTPTTVWPSLLGFIDQLATVLSPPGQRCEAVCLNSFGNWSSPSDNSNDRWKRLRLVSWAAAPCVWTLTAPTRNPLTYLLTYLSLKNAYIAVLSAELRSSYGLIALFCNTCSVATMPWFLFHIYLHIRYSVIVADNLETLAEKAQHDLFCHSRRQGHCLSPLHSKTQVVRRHAVKTTWPQLSAPYNKVRIQ